jgi:hypothetical protein
MDKAFHMLMSLWTLSVFDGLFVQSMTVLVEVPLAG